MPDGRDEGTTGPTISVPTVGASGNGDEGSKHLLPILFPQLILSDITHDSLESCARTHELSRITTLLHLCRANGRRRDYAAQIERSRRTNFRTRWKTHESTSCGRQWTKEAQGCTTDPLGTDESFCRRHVHRLSSARAGHPARRARRDLRSEEGMMVRRGDPRHYSACRDRCIDAP
jgi:hypothetical protein